MVWFVRSVCPSVSGRYAVDIFGLMSRILRNSFQKSKGEPHILIRDYAFWNTVNSPDLFNEYLGQVWCLFPIFQKRDEVRHFRKPVDYYPYFRVPF